MYIRDKKWDDVSRKEWWPICSKTYLVQVIIDHKLTVIDQDRSVTFAQVDDDKRKEILVGDGWHQNYGTTAEPRLSIIDYDNKSGTYKLKNIDNEKGQFQISKIHAVEIDGQDVILAAGDRWAAIFEPKKQWKKTVFHKLSDTTRTFDFAYLGRSGKNLKIATLTGDLSLKVVKLE